MTLSPQRAVRACLATVVLAVGVLLLVRVAPVSAAQVEQERTVVVQGPGPGPVVVPPAPRDTRPEPSTPGTASISGTVVSADGRRPVRRATVRFSPTVPGPPLRAVTDDEGRFVLDGVAAGRFTLSVSKPGYLDSSYGQRQPGSGRPGTEMSVAEGQRIERLVLPIARGGVLAGTVTDDRGEPAFGTDVRAFRYVWQSGERTLRLVASDRADDRGGYRIGALPPGDYVVMATPPGDQEPMFVAGGFRGVGPGFTAQQDASLAVLRASAATNVTDGYAPVYYPASRSSGGAVVISLGTGEERVGLDIAMPFTPLGRVTGLATGFPGSPSAVEIWLIDLEDALGTPERTAIAGPDGSFSFDGVPPGRYRLEAHSGPQRHVFVDQTGGQTRVTMTMRAAPAGAGPSGPPGPGGPLAALGGAESERQYWATAEVYVTEGDTLPVVLQLEPGVTVSGRVAFDGTGTPPADPSSIRVVFNAASQRDAGVGSAVGQVAEDGTFTVTDVMPGRYRVSVIGVSSWRAKSFDVMGQDALDTLLEVAPDRHVTDAILTFTARLATLSGSLREPSGQPAPAYTVVLFAEDRTYWTPQSRRIHATRPGTDGRFSIAGLPSGRYRLAALEDVEDGRWFDPTLLEEVAPLSIPVTLTDGEAKVQDIQVAR